MKNKICTSLEQSKKLMELGIDVNTANMMWEYEPDKDVYWDKPTIIPIDSYIFINDIPAWSLSALLGLMPKLYEFEDDPNDGGCQPDLCKGWDNNQWHIVYRSSIYITEWHDDPIDAAFEMIVWLKENGKI